MDDSWRPCSPIDNLGDRGGRFTIGSEAALGNNERSFEQHGEQTCPCRARLRLARHLRRLGMLDPRRYPCPNKAQGQTLGRRLL